MIILKKLHTVDVVYSFVNIHNQRLAQIAQEKTFTQTLDFVLIAPDGDVMPLPDPIILDRFCIHILCKIHHNVKSLAVESASIERILLATDYPNLTELKIFRFEDELVSNYFTGKEPFHLKLSFGFDRKDIVYTAHIFRSIIISSHPFIAYKTPIEISVHKHYLSDVHEYLFKFFDNLKHFSLTGPFILLTLLDSLSTLFQLCVHVYEF